MHMQVIYDNFTVDYLHHIMLTISILSTCIRKFVSIVAHLKVSPQRILGDA